MVNLARMQDIINKMLVSAKNEPIMTPEAMINTLLYPSDISQLTRTSAPPKPKDVGPRVGLLSAPVITAI